MYKTYILLHLTATYVPVKLLRTHTYTYILLHTVKIQRSHGSYFFNPLRLIYSKTCFLYVCTHIPINFSVDLLDVLYVQYIT